MKPDREDAPQSGQANGLQLARCIVVLLLGFCAGMQLGKIAPIAGFLQAHHGYTLTVIGWLTALIGLFVAFAALPAAKYIDRVGPVSGIRLGAIILTAGAVLLAATSGLVPHLVARVIEAIGYVLLVIAAPAYLATSAAPHHRPVLLALWGSFVPVGYAIANLQADYVMDWFNAPATLASAALLLGLFLIAAISFIPASNAPDRASVIGGSLKDMTRPAGLLASAFGVYVLLSLSFFTFLPVFLEAMPGNQAVSPAAIAVFVPMGNIAAALMLAFVPARHISAVTFTCFAVSALCSAFLFRGPLGQLEVISYFTFAFLGGIIASMIFGSVPQATSNRFSAALVVGVIAQAGGIGTLAGPPLAGFVVDTFGWSAHSALLTALSVFGALMMVPLAWSAKHTTRNFEKVR